MFYNDARQMGKKMEERFAGGKCEIECHRIAEIWIHSTCTVGYII